MNLDSIPPHRLIDLLRTENYQYIARLLKYIYCIPDAYKHAIFLAEEQIRFDDKGAWSEYIYEDTRRKLPPAPDKSAPLATSEVLMALRHLVEYGYADSDSRLKEAIKRALRYLKDSVEPSGGVRDLSPCPLVDATGCTLAALSYYHKKGWINALNEVELSLIHI